MLAVPGFVGNALEPLIGVLGDTRRRRLLLAGGGVVLAISTALSALATGFWPLLLALVLGNPAVTAFVSFSQAALMDREPSARERNMARWTLAGSVGVVAGPVLLGAAVALGAGWRGALLALAAVTLPLTWAAARSVPRPQSEGDLKGALRGVLEAVRRREVLRWLALLAGSDLMLDVFHGFLALYLVDVGGLTPLEAALGVSVWAGAGLVGDALLLVVLRRVSGAAYLRASAAVVTFVFPVFLVVDRLDVRLLLLGALGLLNSGWYAIPKAGLYSSLAERSGTAIAVGSLNGFAQALIPLALGLLAQTFGLGAAMWLLLLSPLVLLVLAPRRSY